MMIKNILGIFIALSILTCAVFSPQYISTIVAFPLIYLVFKTFSHKIFIKENLFVLSFIVYLLVFTLNYIIVNHTNVVVRHDVQSFTISSDDACIQQNRDISLIISCSNKPLFNFGSFQYHPVEKDTTFKIVSVDSDSDNFNHSVVVKMINDKEKIFFIRVNNNEIGEFKINGNIHPITNDLLINISYIASIPVALLFIAVLGTLFFI